MAKTLLTEARGFPGSCVMQAMLRRGIEVVAPPLKLVTTPAILPDVKARLARNRTAHALFDTDRFRRHVEFSYVTMWERAQRGEPRDVFRVTRYESTPALPFVSGAIEQRQVLARMAEEFRKDGIGVNALWPRTVIATAALAMIPGAREQLDRTRKPDIMADAAYAVLTCDARTTTGLFPWTTRCCATPASRTSRAMR